MAITYGKDKTAAQKADAAKKRGSYNNPKPGYKPPATAKVKPQKNGVKVTLKF